METHVLIRTDDGRDVKFRKMNFRIRGKIEDIIVRWKKQRESENLVLAGFPEDVVAEKLRALDNEGISNDCIAACLNSNSGSYEIFKAHFDDPTCDYDEIVEHIDRNELLGKLWPVSAPADGNPPKPA